MFKFGLQRVFLPVLLVYHMSLLRVCTTQENAHLTASPYDKETGVELSWEPSSGNDYLYHLQRAPTAYSIPPPQMTEGFAFNMENYIKYSNITWSSQNYDLELEFRTFAIHRPSLGMLFYTKSQSDGEFVMLGIKGVHLFLTLNCEGYKRSFDMDWHSLNSSYGKWHKIKIHRQERNISVGIKVENLPLSEREYHCSANNQTNTSKALVVIGGLPSGIPFQFENSLTSNSEVSHGFVGCIRGVNFNGQLLDSISTTDESNIMHKPPNKSCLANIERGMHFGEDGYVKYSEEINTTSGVIHELRFKTRRQNWVLLYVNKTSSFYSLRLLDGQLVFTRNEDNTTLQHEKALCDNTWYDVVLSCSNISCYVKLNNETLPDQIEFSGTSYAGSSLYLGGQPKDVPTSNDESGYNFKGCLQDLSHLKNTKYIEEVVNVDVLGCPMDDGMLMAKCSDISFDSKYIGYESSFVDTNLVPMTEYQYRVEVRKPTGETIWSKWTKTKSNEKVCNAIEDYLAYLIIGGAVACVIIIALIIAIVLVNRRRKHSQTNASDLSMKERKLTTGQRYIQNDRSQTSTNESNSFDPLEQPYDDTTQPIQNLQFTREQPEEIIYQNVPRNTTNFQAQTPNQHYDDNGDLIYENVEDEEEMYGNSEVIRRSKVI